MRKAAVLFPGIGYSVERPLLYYSGKMARAQGYDVIPVPYSGFPKKQAGSHDMLLKAFQIGRNEAEVLLKDAHLEACDDLIFFSKSIGTAIGASGQRSVRPMPTITTSTGRSGMSCTRLLPKPLIF